MDGIMTGWHRLGLLEMVWISDYVDFNLQMLEKEPSLDWFRVWVEPTEASVGLKIIVSMLVCHDNAERPKGPDEKLVHAGTRVSDPSVKSPTFLPLCRGEGGREREERDRLEEILQLSWVTVRCSWEHRYDNGSDPVSL